MKARHIAHTVEVEPHSALDFDHDGRVSAFELVAATAIGVAVLSVAFAAGALFVSFFCS